ncbi:16S rRNA (cytosine(1407)-C(5))-methyltransferase RsmF [Shewanella intestini]|uniref:Ribosomal RNA small subunit methyltransferase F n=1 Tax=Shewanella intestini TaxID=2017544 RepID=A0ABS5I1E6_9GAMM|nr:MULTISPECIES: 16S rRNA (cytosine(1407)-C(5))-methyltransferase RsmF [Shewanella]MBR9727845.1 16S rRNA (cytosine(1407)-C(5))-methyltransferase RsmF [Shewanella intestini]MRG36162.1 16S rRNA (cytosine(1407)-C(5))-methyltransferase RsmF [Shewanella sp. XMDDZSB0408]
MAQINPNFIKHIQQELPNGLHLDEFIDYCLKPLRKSIRVNTLKISATDFQALMQPKGWHFEAIPWCNDGFWVTFEQEPVIGNLIEHIQGLFYVQEASSMLPPIALFDNLSLTHPTILDVASAPGSKSTQMAAMMQNNGLLVANEYSSSRVKVLHANMLRMGVYNTALTHFDGRVFGEYMYEQFDAILLDAPCGGEGTIRKDSNALKNWQLEDVIAIAETQQELITSAFLALKPGAEMVYSTCTLSQLENQQICQFLKQQYPNEVEFVPLDKLFNGADKACTPEGFLHVWPQTYDSEGFFVAKIKKLASVARLKKQPKPQKVFPFTDIPAKDLQILSHYLLKQYQISLPQNSQIKVRDKECWLFPQSIMPLIGKMRYQRIGIKLADILKKGFKIKHEALIALTTDNFTGEPSIELDANSAVNFLKGRDIAVTDLSIEQQHYLQAQVHGEMRVLHSGATLGMVKYLGHRLKNGLPRELVNDNACM